MFLATSAQQSSGSRSGECPDHATSQYLAMEMQPTRPTLYGQLHDASKSRAQHSGSVKGRDETHICASPFWASFHLFQYIFQYK